MNTIIWISVDDSLPNLTKEQRNPDQFGVRVLIWPHHNEDGCAAEPTAFFGTRLVNEPWFYLYGRGIQVTHWAYLPQGPKA